MDVQINEWKLRTSQRSVGRHQKRWVDDVKGRNRGPVSKKGPGWSGWKGLRKEKIAMRLQHQYHGLTSHVKFTGSNITTNKNYWFSTTLS